MLTGTAPIGTFQLPTTLRPELPKHVNDVVELALANSPDDRYQSARDLINNVQRTFEQPIGEEPQVGPAIGIAAGIAGVIFILAIAALLYMVRGDPKNEAILADQALRKDVAEWYEQNAQTEDEVKAIYAKHPKGMIYIPSGPYINGRHHYDPNALGS